MWVVAKHACNLSTPPEACSCNSRQTMLIWSSSTLALNCLIQAAGYLNEACMTKAGATRPIRSNSHQGSYTPVRSMKCMKPCSATQCYQACRGTLRRATAAWAAAAYSSKWHKPTVSRQRHLHWDTLCSACRANGRQTWPTASARSRLRRQQKQLATTVCVDFFSKEKERLRILCRQFNEKSVLYRAAQG